MILAENFPQNGPLHFQANNIPGPKSRTQISFAVNAFVFATWIIQSVFFLNPKFQAFSFILGLYRPVCVGPGRKPRRPIFLRGDSFTSGNNTRNS